MPACLSDDPGLLQRAAGVTAWRSHPEALDVLNLLADLLACLLRCAAGVYSVGAATPKQVLSCAEMAKQRHAELLAQLEAAANKMEEA